MEYKLSKQRGALNEAGTPPPQEQRQSVPQVQNAILASSVPDYAEAHHTLPGAPARLVRRPVADPVRGGLWFATIDEGHRVLVTGADGQGEVVKGPRRLFRWGGGGRRRFQPLVRHVAHPGEFLIVRRRDGAQEHLRGPTDLWQDPREHASVEVEDVLRLDAKEAVVVYAQAPGGGGGEAVTVSRRIVHGPAAFVPEPGEWLHTFSWHGSRFVPGSGSNGRYLKIPGALEFQKLWLMPDQMYHDVPDVRTADDALLTVRLMIFFELRDVERMLDATHDPIGDFVNAATSDVIDWVGRHDFGSFKRNSEQLNDLATYRQLVGRAAQCGYALHKVVYRGYGATAALQRMHDEAIESRTKLMLERATELQSQELVDGKLEREHARAGRRRAEEDAQVGHDLAMARRRQEAELEADRARRAFERDELAADRATERTHLEGLHGIGVDLTRYLVRDRPDRVLEVRGEGVPHVHVP